MSAYSEAVEKAYRDEYYSLERKEQNALNVRRRYWLAKGDDNDTAKLKAIYKDPAKFRQKLFPAVEVQRAFRGKKVRERANKQKTCMEGLKRALPDALEGRRDKVRFETIFKKRLAEVEATDACDLFDKAVAILTEMKPKLFILRTATIKPKPEPKYIENPEVVADIKKMLIQYQKGLTVFQDYQPDSFVISSVLLYILKKYKNNCYIFTRKIAGDEGLWKSGIEFVDWDETKGEWGLAPIKEDLVKAVGSQIVNCKTNGVKLIAIPMAIPGHQNMLVYRVNENSFERFEPHGEAFSSEGWTPADEKLLNSYLTKFVGDLEAGGYIPEGAKIYYANDICPSFSFQGEEGDQWEQLGLGDSGFCQMWSVFFLEMVLKYPDESGAEVASTAFREMKAMGPFGFARHIAEYSKQLEDELKKINPSYSIKAVKKTSTELFEWLQSEFKKMVLSQGLKARSKAVGVCSKCEA
jgi:hypothetical protein